MSDLVQTLRALAAEHYEMLGDIHEPLNSAANEIERLETTLRFAAGYISGTPPFASWHPEDVYAWVKGAAAELCKQ